ncbi:MAG TPA: hypothetical protein VKA63_04675 [Candidatus Krumholzibacteria bacterium]|nr:hypothetical protein [Candidatus Krumholzibacteria bacterium]
MSAENKKDSRWLEILGLATVVVSVLLLAWQIRQNTQTATAQAMLNLNTMANEVLSAEAQSAQLAAVLVKGEEDLESLSPVEYRQFQSHVYASINAIKAAHGFFTEGILDEVAFSGWRDYTCPYLGGSSVNAIYESFKPTWGTEFVAFVEETCGF